MSEFPFNEVEGLLSPEDRVVLHQLAGDCIKVPGDYFEIGSYYGLSALCIASAMVGPRKLYCYDWFESHKLAEFLKNTEPFKDRIEIRPGDFSIQSLKGQWFAFGFIDHDHGLKTTQLAYDMFWPRMAKGGILAFHDYGHPDYPGPKEFLDSLPHEKETFGPIITFKKP